MRPQIRPLPIHITEHHAAIEPGHVRVRVLRVPPAQRVDDHAALADLVRDAGAHELGDGRPAVVRRARLLVQLRRGFEHVHGDAVLGEEQREEEARGAGAYYEDLVEGG
jgi:hypothetical protein